MTTQEFKRQMKEAGFEVRKRNGLEVFDVGRMGTRLFFVSYAELYRLADISPLLAQYVGLVYIPSRESNQT